MDQLLVQLTQDIREEYNKKKKSTKNKVKLFNEIRKHYYLSYKEKLCMPQWQFLSSVSTISIHLRDEEERQEVLSEIEEQKPEEITPLYEWERIPFFYEITKHDFNLAD